MHETILNVEQRVFATVDVWHIHVVGGWAQLFKLLSGEDINGDEMDLGVSVLAGLGGAHIDNLAGPALNHDVSVLAESRALHGEGAGGTGARLLEGVVVLLIVVGHFED